MEGVAVLFAVGFFAIPLVITGMVLVMWSRLKRVRGEVEDLVERVRLLEARGAVPAMSALAPALAPPLPSLPPVAPVPSTQPGVETPRRQTPAPIVRLPASSRPPVAMPARPPRLESSPASADLLSEIQQEARAETSFSDPSRELVDRARAWLLGGNAVVRVGVVVLLFGVGFFLNFAIDSGWLPIELRLMTAAIAGVALMGVGWQLRTDRRDYGIVLQGGGMGVVYLSVFAAVNLYGLVAAGAGLIVMVVLVAVATGLALLQDAKSLAILATCAGFAAPLLVSSEGSHVGLFSYYAALNVGIVAIAWFKQWPLLNFLGFVFTFLISAVWGDRFYQPEYFASTEPFLVAFFLLYVAVPVLHELRVRLPERRLHGFLIFGVPLMAFGLQAGLVRGLEYGLAYSAVSVSVFYLGLAYLLWRRLPESGRLLVDGFAALGVAFGTLTIPLAVDARWTASAWALEGAGLLWIGVNQRRRLATAVGVLLQFLAGASFLSGSPLPVRDVPIVNSIYIGALTISAACMFCAWYVRRYETGSREIVSKVSNLLLAWGLLWWAGAGVREVEVHAGAYAIAGSLGLVTISSVALVSLRAVLAWPQLRVPVLLQLPAMWLALLASIDGHPFAQWAGPAWAAAIGIHYWAQRRLESEWAAEPARYWHGGMLWLIVALLSWETAWLAGQLTSIGSVWAHLAVVLVPAVSIVAVERLIGLPLWPFDRFAGTYKAALTPIVFFAVGWVLRASTNPGDPSPLPYVPLLNPLEMGQAVVLAVLAMMRALRDRTWISSQSRWLCGMVVTFVALNGVVARATHFYAGVPFDFDALWASARYQSALSITWTIAAMLVMLRARTNAQRTVWFTGTALLAAVVLKLFAVDLDGVGTVARMTSFVVVGLLILLVGYLSPMPPRARQDVQA